jgi:hypothetical protein
MLIRISWIGIPLIFLVFSLTGVGSVLGQGTPAQPQEPSSDFNIPKAIEGFDEQKVKDDPICDSSAQPHIQHVKPDELKSGDTVVVEGTNFGKKKDCLHDVTFGSITAKTFKFVDNEHIEATVPDGLRAGVTFLHVVTGGGSAKKGILIKSKD